MSNIQGIDRSQSLIFPERLEDYIGPEDVCRLIDAFVESLEFGVEKGSNEKSKEGRPSYSAQTMAKLYIWGYLNNVRSSRKLEYSARYNIQVLWLLQKLSPDHCSISRFRKSYAVEIKDWLKQFNLICDRLSLFGKKELSVDGAILKAVNNRSKSYTQKRLEGRIDRISQEIEEYLNALEKNDTSEESLSSTPVSELTEKLKKLQQAKQETEAMLKKAKQSPTGQFSKTDPDARVLSKKNLPGRSVVGYNAQSVVDSKHDLIGTVKVTQKSGDQGQLTEMAKKALVDMDIEVNCDKPDLRVLADAGYCDYNDLAKAEKEGFELYVNTQTKKVSQYYRMEDFTYNPTQDNYRCPGNQILSRGKDKKIKKATYKIYRNRSACKNCSLCDSCTKGKYRTLFVHKNQDTIDRIRKRMKENPEIYERRAPKVEHPFGSMLFWNEGRNLLCKGVTLANAEFSLSALSYNIKRAVKLKGVKPLIEAITSLFIKSTASIRPIRPLVRFS